VSATIAVAVVVTLLLLVGAGAALVVWARRGARAEVERDVATRDRADLLDATRETEAAYAERERRRAEVAARVAAVRRAGPDAQRARRRLLFGGRRPPGADDGAPRDGTAA